VKLEDLPEEIRTALEQGQAVICPTKCWECQFGQHSRAPHTWMDQEDAEHAGHPWPLTPETALAHPCGCYCTGGTR
jgi:hypothetical protein